MSDFTLREIQGGFTFKDKNGKFSMQEKNGSFNWKADYDKEPQLDPLNTFVGVIVRFYCKQTHN